MGAENMSVCDKRYTVSIRTRPPASVKLFSLSSFVFGVGKALPWLCRSQPVGGGFLCERFRGLPWLLKIRRTLGSWFSGDRCDPPTSAVSGEKEVTDSSVLNIKHSIPTNFKRLAPLRGL